MASRCPGKDVGYEPSDLVATDAEGGRGVVPQQLIDAAEYRRQPQAAAAFLAQDWGWGSLGTLRRLVEFNDRRLQASALFLIAGFCVVLYGIVVNPEVNPEHLLVGFFLFVLGVAIAILMIGGGGAGRAADRLEGFLMRRFFF